MEWNEPNQNEVRIWPQHLPMRQLTQANTLLHINTPRHIISNNTHLANDNVLFYSRTSRIFLIQSTISLISCWLSLQRDLFIVSYLSLALSLHLSPSIALAWYLCRFWFFLQLTFYSISLCMLCAKPLKFLQYRRFRVINQKKKKVSREMWRIYLGDNSTEKGKKNTEKLQT